MEPFINNRSVCLSSIQERSESLQKMFRESSDKFKALLSKYRSVRFVDLTFEEICNMHNDTMDALEKQEKLLEASDKLLQDLDAYLSE